ncbi:phage recombination protein Bet, partial [Bifidobacterium sp. B4107]|uniref:phage recombination protein Bet n=1 Tax=unclassified Bifidobacterium TaxID=2608897 RepID=UPI00226BB63B
MSSDLTITDKQDGFTANQVAALQQMGVQNASQGDLAVFFHQVQRTGLDPFARQIYMIGRNQKTPNGWETKYTIQTGIDGFRLIARRAAERSHEAFGEPETLWCGEDGVWREVWLGSKPPKGAKVVVQRGGGSFTGVATLSEYAGRKKDGSLTSMWASKPALMLAKCAEALALRKAFPQDLSGLYTEDEMHDDVQDAQPAQPVQAVVMSTK